MDESLTFALVLSLLFIMGMVAAWVVRLMIRKEVIEEVDRQFDERNILRGRKK